MKSSTVKIISTVLLILSLLAGTVMLFTVLLAATGASIIFGGIVVFVLLRVIAAILEHLEAIRENTEAFISASTWQCVACGCKNVLNSERCTKCGAVKR